MNTLSSLSILIPTYNNETTIQSVLRSAAVVASQTSRRWELLICNDGSVDDTGQILAAASSKDTHIRVIVNEKNMGYGYAIRTLYESAKYAYMFSLPGDDQIPARELKKLVPHITRNDIVLGHRTTRKETLARRVQTRVYNTLLQTLFDIDICDINSVRLMKKSAIRTLALTTWSPFVDAELVIRAIRSGMDVTEVPIDHKNRISRGATGGSLLRTILPTARDMIQFYLSHNGPM